MRHASGAGKVRPGTWFGRPYSGRRQVELTLTKGDAQGGGNLSPALFSRTVATLRAARGRADAVRDAVGSYIREAYRIGMTPGELIDDFCVSTPNIVEEAGYAGSDGEGV